MRLDDAITYFLSDWPAEGPTIDTQHAYAIQLKWLAGFAARQRRVLLSDLTPAFLRSAMVAKMDARNTSRSFKGGESSAKALVCAARRMAVWLRAQGVSVADLSVVRGPKVPERIQPRLREDEFMALEGAILRRLVDSRRRVPRLAIARDLALIYLLADTGLRAHEVCSMVVDDIDFDAGCVRLIRGKGKKQRALSIVDPDDPGGGATLKLLSDWVAMRSGVRGAARSSSLWVSMKGNPLNREELRKVLARICVEAGLDETRPPHAFRRAAFTEAYLASPTSIRVLASRMGWSDKSHHMIDVYTRGAEVELARTTPVASVSSRWRRNGSVGKNRATLNVAVGVGEGKSNAPALPNVGTRDRTRRASTSPLRGPQHSF